MDTLNPFLPMSFKIHAANHVYKFIRDHNNLAIIHKSPFLGGVGERAVEGRRKKT